MTDIDIDVPDREKILQIFDNIPAMMKNRGKTKKHVSGVYFHKVPQDPFNGFCSLDYKKSEELGFFKLDLLNVSLYQEIENEEHLTTLMEREPIWELLEHKEFCDLLFHLNGHHGVCQKMKPNSIEKLAATLAIIRPAKKHLIGKSWKQVMEEVWLPPKDDSYYFKKAHAFSYSFTVKVHMNLICEKLV
jgi:hypothetical protein